MRLIAGIIFPAFMVATAAYVVATNIFDEANPLFIGAAAIIIGFAFISWVETVIMKKRDGE